MAVFFSLYGDPGNFVGIAIAAAANPTDKAKVYAEMGIDITYHQDGRVVVESRPRVVESVVGEPFRWRTTRTPALVTSFWIT